MVRQCLVHCKLVSQHPWLRPTKWQWYITPVTIRNVFRHPWGSTLAQDWEPVLRSRTLSSTSTVDSILKTIIPGCLLTFSPQLRYPTCRKLALWGQCRFMHCRWILWSLCFWNSPIHCGIRFSKSLGRSTCRMPPFWICQITSSCCHLTVSPPSMFPVHWTAGPGTMIA